MFGSRCLGIRHILSVLLIAYIVCQTAAYPQDSGGMQRHATSQADITEQAPPRQPLPEQRRVFIRRHSNSSQPQRSDGNATQPLVNINAVPRAPQRATVRLSSATIRVSGDQARTKVAQNETRRANLTRPDVEDAVAAGSDSRPADVSNESTRSDGPSSRRVGGAPGRGTDAADLARWNTDKPAQDKQLRAGSRIKLPNEGGIVFPGQEKGSIMNRPRYVPRVSGDEAPHCANGLTFCETAADGYPNDHLRRVLKTDAVVFRQLFGNDDVTLTNITQRIDTSEESSLCVSIEEIIYPKIGLTKEDKWLYIVNQDQYVQGVRIERCRNPDSECSFIDTFPLGYRTYCKQKYIYRKMLAVTADGEPNTDSFKLPACCSCHVVRADGAASRMAFDPATQSEAPGARRKRRGRSTGRSQRH